VGLAGGGVVAVAAGLLALAALRERATTFTSPTAEGGGS